MVSEAEILSDYKQEAIATMNMGTYTKIFLHFDQKFWFDTEVGALMYIQKEAKILKQ
jgi:polyamine oxidase